MTKPEQELVDFIRNAFRARSIPTGRIIASDIDLSYHEEAKRVDRYLRERIDKLDRHNSALSAFYYLTPGAALWALPYYFITIIANFSSADLILDIVLHAIASGPPDYCRLGYDIGVEMRKIASDGEALAVCRFCRWLREKDDDPGFQKECSAALSIWCGDV